MIKNKFLSPELTRLALVIIGAKIVINIILANMVLGVCYAKDHELTRQLDRSIIEEQLTK